MTTRRGKPRPSGCIGGIVKDMNTKTFILASVLCVVCISHMPREAHAREFTDETVAASAYIQEQLKDFSVALPSLYPQTRSSAVLRIGRAGELLRSVQTTPRMEFSVAKKTKTYRDRRSGITLHYPSSADYVLRATADPRILAISDSLRMVELEHRTKKLTVGYVMISNQIGSLFWSIITEGNRESIQEMAREGIQIGKSSLPLQSGYATSTFAKNTIRNDFVSYNGLVYMGVYSGLIPLGDGTLMGVALFYSDLPGMGLQSQRDAQESLATLMTRSTVDTKRFMKALMSKK